MALRSAAPRWRSALALAALAAGGAGVVVAVLVGWDDPVPTAADAPPRVAAAGAAAAPAARPAPPPAAMPGPAPAGPVAAPAAAAAPAPAGLSPAMSPGEWLAGHARDWRVARLAANPAVLVIEFPSLAEQGAAMNRLAALLEKAGAPRDRVLDDQALGALIRRAGDNPQTFYLGHDYTGQDLARFFAMAAGQGLLLGPQEQRLQQVLAQAGVLQPGAPQAVVTFSAAQRDDPATPEDETVDARRRESVLLHELSHGAFFTQPAYRARCEQFWQTVLDERQRGLLRRYLAGRDYDPANELLLINETQALLFHTPDDRAFSPADAGLGRIETAKLRLRFNTLR